MQAVFFASLIALSAVPVEVSPLSGPPVRGDLTECSLDAVVIQAGGGPQRWEPAQLRELSATTAPPPGERPATVWVELLDGSIVCGDKYTAAAGLATIHTLSGQSLAIRTASIKALRFRDYASAPQLADRWQQVTAAKATGDSLVVRRGDSLDQVLGAIGDVTDEVVQFEADGEVIQAKRGKLEGLLYYHPAVGELPPRSALVTDVFGTQWSVKSLRSGADRLELVSVAGVAAALPLNELKRIDFSSGNSQWLDALEPESLQWRPYIESRAPDASLSRWFQPRGSAAPNGLPLVLDGQTHARGLRICSRTEIVYRLAGEFRQFQAVAGIDDSVRPAGNVRLVIHGDDKELFSQVVTGTDKPLDLAVDITGVKRLRILVDFGAQIDIADGLNLCDARITK